MTRQIYGQQKDWNKIRQTTDEPIITIITATFNVAETLHWTYQSIKNQTYPYIQWIVVDGASKDGTSNVLQEYSDVIDVWFSEPDKGIYDAWNKALDYVKGDWVQFLGAGDALYEADVIGKIVLEISNKNTKNLLISTDIALIDDQRQSVKHLKGEWCKNNQRYSLLLPILPPHPGIFHHKKLFYQKRFDVDFKIISDSLFLLTNTNLQFRYMPILTVNMLLGGISSDKDSYTRSYQEMTLAIKKYQIKLNLFNRLKAFLKLKIKEKICQ